MSRNKLLEIGLKLADRWYKKNLPVLKARQNIARQKNRLTRHQA